ncbi:MAG: DUF4954 family protein [Sphaerochaetaceae bacterium]
MKREPINTYGYNFVPNEFLEDSRDEYTLRNKQIEHWDNRWRSLRDDEILFLETLGNTSASWDHVYVEDPIDLSLIRNSSFYGLVRIGSLQPSTISYHDFVLPEGIRDSHIVSCDINRHCAIYKIAYLSHYQIDTMCMLHRIDEMDTTNHSKFGNGVIKDGESEEVRVKLSIMNENDNRAIHPFVSMRCADAALWGTYREYPELQKKLLEFTGATVDRRRGYYGYVGPHSVIKSCRIIKDVAFGSHVYVKGANKLKNLTIRSDENAPSQIGEGVELVNGILGYGTRVFYGVKAVCFMLGDNSNLKYGARLLHSFLGENSTVSCCEVLNSLVYPFHEQHHNNSFLIAAMIQGQSNMAAGANIGSNHNTRGADGELKAKRGFWPALSSSLKYNCSFASFSLITKGSYPNELKVPIPFSMISYNEAKRVLNVMPAYWWMYNRYALERNEWKFGNRDRRYYKKQHIETSYISLDTIEEILDALEYLSYHVALSAIREGMLDPPPDNSRERLVEIGSQLLESSSPMVNELHVVSYDIERSKRGTRLLKVQQGYNAYKEMLIFGCMQSIVEYMVAHSLSFETFEREASSYSESPFGSRALKGPSVNLGGQIVSEALVLDLIDDIENGRVSDWDEIHQRYDLWNSSFGKTKAVKSYQALCTLYKADEENPLEWKSVIATFIELCTENARQIRLTREKDFHEVFRSSVYRSEKEKISVLGSIEDDSFIIRSQQRMNQLITRVSDFSC